MLKIS